MRTNVWVVVLVWACLIGMLTGCKSTNTLAQTEMQARLQTITEQVRLAAANRGDVALADYLSNVPKSGASGFSQRKDALKNPDGTYLLDSDGNVQYGSCVAVGLANSMRDFGNLSECYLVLGGPAPDVKAGSIEGGAAPGGLFLYFTGAGVSSGVNSEFAAVWAQAPATEKNAAANAVATALAAWKGLTVEGITAAGTQVIGVLKEVYKATPIGAASAAVDVLISAGGKDVPATITAPFVGRPRETGAAAVPGP